MKLSKYIGGTVLTLTILPGLVSADSIRSQFQHCAATALNAPISEAGKIDVNISRAGSILSYNDLYRSNSTLEMTLNNKLTGKAFANVVCKVSPTGKVLKTDIDYLSDEIPASFASK